MTSFKNTFTFALSLVLLGAIGLACGGSSKPAPPEYVGFWTGAEGTTITIRADGGADYKSGNGNSNVSGGSFVMSEDGKSFKIGFAGMGPSFKIDKAPSGNQMTLDGIVFKKTGGGSDTKSDTKTSSTKPEIPSNDKLQSLVKSTFMDFSDAVQGEDFTDFHKKVAKVWRDSSSPDDMLESFKVFVDEKENYNFKKAVSSLDATFEPAPVIEDFKGIDALIVKGYYPTKPEQANFELKYAMDDGNWKLVGINIKTTRK